MKITCRVFILLLLQQVISTSVAHAETLPDYCKEYVDNNSWPGVSIATVDGNPVTQQELDILIEGSPSNSPAYTNETENDRKAQQFLEERDVQVKLDKIVRMRAMEIEVVKLGALQNTQIKQQIDSMCIKEAEELGKHSEDKSVIRANFSLERTAFLAKVMFNHHLAKKQFDLSDKKLREEYDKHYISYDYRLSAIDCDNDTQALKLINRLAEGVPFSELAKQQCSSQPILSTADLGWGGANILGAENISGMKTGDYSRTPIERMDHYVVFMVTDMRAISRTKFSQVKDSIARSLLDAESEKYMNEIGRRYADKIKSDKYNFLFDKKDVW